MASASHKSIQRDNRHRRVRAKVHGTEARPRLSVYKSNTQVIAQVINDENGSTIASVVSLNEKGKTPRERAIEAARTLTKNAKGKGVSHVVFDRGGFEYTGTIKAFADAAREAGLIF